MPDVQSWLTALPIQGLYALIFLIIGLESMGIPLPGEIALVSASLLAAAGKADPFLVASFAAAGAIIGDSIGYAIGRRGGRPLLERLGRRFPKHLGPPQLAQAERLFGRWGVWAVFFGRFVALLRILAGPLAGAMHVPYRKFLLANAGGGLVWAFGTVFALYYLGQVAQQWLKGFSWVGLVAAVVVGLGTTWWLKRRAHRAVADADQTPAGDGSAVDATRQ
ncbi:DedA family protein [Pilimelia columellifera]|uniref:DedA family protein n=1 Tax=Pilimelia columellifera subsp. columellifera TaxID=706583 RepID=A0ABN3N4U0_9ACTN